MSLFVAVNGIADGENVDAATLNRPTYQLVERTNFLKQQISSLTESGIVETMRILSAPLLTSGALAPVVGDVVYLDATTGLYTKAVSGVGTADIFSASNTSYAVGIVISVSGTTGTIVTFGRQALATGGSPWALASLLESGEAFRSGPYYLSALEPGKITANPSGPAIYIGYFTEDTSNPGYGGFALLSPQYKDLAQSHIHRDYPLYAQPAGTQAISGPTPTDTHAVLGFEPLALSATPGDQQPRLVITGTWSGLTDTQYTIWLSASGTVDTTPAGSVAPTSFGDYIHWVSSDAAEGAGVSRIWSYEVPVAIGTKGLMASLENNLATDWDVPYNVTTDTEDQRTWQITAPTQTRGWLANKLRQNFSASTKDYSIILTGGPHTSVDGRSADTLTVKCAKIYRIDYVANPTDADTVTVGTAVYEFDDNSTLTTPTNIMVSIGTDAEASFSNLVDAIIAQAALGVDVALNVADAQLIIAVPTGDTVSSTGVASPVLKYAGTGVINLATAGVTFFAYDEHHRSLLASPSYASGVLYSAPQALTNGLSFMAIPYSATGVAAAAPGTVAAGDTWTAAIIDEANGTPFRYAMGMHSGMAQHYPPIPVQAASLVNNGIELDSYDVFPNTPVYRLGMATLYWYTNKLGTVPWPRDWQSTAVPGSDQYIQNMTLHFVKMTIGNSGIVTSLRPAAGSPLKVTQCGTNQAATVGDLELDLDLVLESENSNLAGYQVVKAVSGKKLQRGPVVEQITSDGSIQITSSAGAANGQGIVSLSVATASYGGEFEEVALQNAKQELIGMFPYIRLSGWRTGATNNIPTAFVAKFRVDHTIDPSKKFKVVVYMTVFGESDIPFVLGGSKKYAGIKFSYSILPDFNPINANVGYGGAAWNSLDQTLKDGLITMNPITAEIPFGRYDNATTPGPGYPIYKAYDPMLIHNNTGEGDVDRKIAQVLGSPFPVRGAVINWIDPDDPVVKAGSLVGIKIERANIVSGAPEYTGSIGFINLRWKLVSV